MTGHGDFADSFVEMDTRVGALVDLLDELAIADDTVVIVTSDNGAEDVVPWRGWTGPWGGSYVNPWRPPLRTSWRRPQSSPDPDRHSRPLPALNQSEPSTIVF